MSERIEPIKNPEEEQQMKEYALELAYRRAKKRMGESSGVSQELFEAIVRDYRKAKQEFLDCLEAERKRQLSTGENKQVVEGSYPITVEYPGRRRIPGKTDEFERNIFEKSIYPIILHQTTTQNELIVAVFGSIQMEGLHNFGLDTDDLGLAPIDITVTKKNDENFPPIRLRCWLDNSGHLARAGTNL